MTETTSAPVPREDLTLSIIVYALFIISLLGVFPAALVGVFMAYVSRGTAGPLATGHFRFQIRTFWIGLAAFAVGIVGFLVGTILSVILIGIPLLIVAILFLGAIWVWALLRCVAGLVWSIQGAPCPRPDSFTV